MQAIVQRITSADVSVAGCEVGRAGRGLLVYLGIAVSDSIDYAGALAEKIANLRIFEDSHGKLNLSIQDVRGNALVIPNFTVMADTRKGRRPSFAQAATAELAESLCETFVDSLGQYGCSVEKGAFGKHMEIRSVADGPVNVIVDFPPISTSEATETKPQAT